MNKCYFLGGNTARGFFSYYDYLIDKQKAKKVYVIKGGPGTGKSSLMKKTAAWAKEKGYSVDEIHCSSDPDSLDGIVIHEIGAAMVDGTAPHIVDPVYPGCVDEIINMGDFWNEEGIRENRSEIIEYTNKISGYYRTAYNYLAAAGKLYKNIIEACGTDSVYACCKGIAASIADREAARYSAIGSGKIRRLFAAAITPKGVISYADTLAPNKTYVLKCGGNMASGKLMEDIAERFVSRGYDTECYYDPLMPVEKIEHICVPELGLAVVSDNLLTHINAKPGFLIDLSGMLPADMPDTEYSFKTINALIDKSAEVIGYAKGIHDKLERCYVPNMDFEAAGRVAKKIISRLETL